MSNDNPETTGGPAGQVDAERRSALVAMAKAMAYVPPAVATFAMGGMTARATGAYVTNLG